MVVVNTTEIKLLRAEARLALHDAQDAMYKLNAETGQHSDLSRELHDTEERLDHIGAVGTNIQLSEADIVTAMERLTSMTISLEAVERAIERTRKVLLKQQVKAGLKLNEQS